MTDSLFTKIDCVRIPVTSLDAGIDFYSTKLNHQIIWRTETSVGLQLKDDKSEIVLYIEPAGLEIDFKVDNVQDAIEAFVQAGGSIVTGPFEIPIGLCVVVRDPWNNEYVLLDSSKGNFETDENKRVIGLKK